MKDRSAVVLANERVADGVMKMTLYFEDLPPIEGGQFVHIRVPDGAHVLRRPFCICDFDKKERTIDVCYAVVGAGTARLAEVERMHRLDALLPLGNGYAPKGDRIMLIGGGMGSAVLPAIITAHPDREYTVCLGFGDVSKVVLADELKAKGAKVILATDNGSAGEKGYVADVAARMIRQEKPDEIFCCGPEIIYKILAQKSEIAGIPTKISLEQRMGCGIGACLVCNCKVRRAGVEEYVRVCKDGPVFDITEVAL